MFINFHEKMYAVNTNPKNCITYCVNQTEVTLKNNCHVI